jgi:Tol biopolymer transport system component
VEVTVDGNTASGPVFIVLEEGSLQVKTNTTGTSLDDSYNILIDEVKEASIGGNGVTTIDIAEGNHKLELSAIANNCATEGMNPRLVTITAEQTSSTTFDVTCKEVLRNHFLFHSNRDGDYEVYAMSSDGSDLQNITNSGATGDGAPVLSNDGQKVAFVSDRSGVIGLYVMNVDGTNTQLVDTQISTTYHYSWAPDDSELVYSDPSSGNEDIYRIKIDGSMKEPLTTNTAEDVFPSWSPDGNTIVFSSDRDGDYELYTINADGSNLQQLTDDAFDYYWARWSPEGSKIAFTSDQDGFAHIYTMDPDGSNMTQITSDTTGVNSAPKWSPDGDDIIFQSDRDGNMEIYKISADGTGSAIRLTNNSTVDGFTL